jgi:hypothetical protein
MSQAPSNCHFLRKAVLFAIRFNSSVLVNVGSSIWHCIAEIISMYRSAVYRKSIMVVFWDGAPCIMVDTERRFGGAYYLHCQAQHPRRRPFSYQSLWKPEISPTWELSTTTTLIIIYNYDNRMEASILYKKLCSYDFSALWITMEQCFVLTALLSCYEHK